MLSCSELARTTIICYVYYPCVAEDVSYEYVFFFFFFESVCIPVYSSVNKPGRSYEPLHLRERI
jgi:hypothetical protein